MSIYFPEKTKKYKDEIRQVEAGDLLVLQYSIGTSPTTAVTLRLIENTKEHAIFLAIDRRDGTTFFHNKTVNDFYLHCMRIVVHSVHVYGHDCEITFDENLNMISTVQVLADEETMYRKVEVGDKIGVQHYGDSSYVDGVCIFVSSSYIVVVSRNTPYTFKRTDLMKKAFTYAGSGDGVRVTQDLFVGIPQPGSVLE